MIMELLYDEIGHIMTVRCARVSNGPPARQPNATPNDGPIRYRINITQTKPQPVPLSLIFRLQEKTSNINFSRLTYVRINAAMESK